MNPGKKPEAIGSDGGCMMLTPIKQQRVEPLDTLPDDMQRRVLDSFSSAGVVCSEGGARQATSEVRSLYSIERLAAHQKRHRFRL